MSIDITSLAPLIDEVQQTNPELGNELLETIQDGYERAAKIAKSLPPLPSVVRYNNELEDRYETIRNLDQLTTLKIAGGTIDFGLFDEAHTKLVKAAFYNLLSNISAFTARTYCYRWQIFEQRKPGLLSSLAGLDAAKAKLIWEICISPNLTNHASGDGLRSFLRYCADAGIGDWNKSHRSLIANLPIPKSNAFNRVKDQSAFIPANDQQKIVRYLDDLARTLASGNTSVKYREIQQAAAMVMSFSYGVRSIQLALMTPDDVTITDYGQTRVRYPWRKQPDRKKIDGLYDASKLSGPSSSSTYTA